MAKSKPKLTPVTVKIRLKSGKTTAGIRHKNLVPAPGALTPPAGPVTAPVLSVKQAAKLAAQEAETAFIASVAYSPEDADDHNMDGRAVEGEGLALTATQIRALRDAAKAAGTRVQAGVITSGFYRENEKFPDEPISITTSAVMVFTEHDGDEIFRVEVSPDPIREPEEGDFDYANGLAESLSRYGVTARDYDNGDGISNGEYWEVLTGVYELTLA